MKNETYVKPIFDYFQMYDKFTENDLTKMHLNGKNAQRLKEPLRNIPS